MTHPIDFFYEYAGYVLRPYMSVESASDSDVCSVCERPSSDWKEPGNKVVFKNYGIIETHCVSCHSLFEGSIELFGVERLAKGTPVPMKLGMATGCGALVTPNGTELFLNGFIKKMGAAKNPPFPMRELSGIKAHQALILNPPSDQQFLYIGNFGRKKRDLVANLTLSTPKRLVICEDSGRSVVSIPVARDLIAASKASGMKAARKNAIKTLLRQYYTGRLSPHDAKLLAELKVISESEPELWQVLLRMPADPHERLNILQLW